MVRWRRSAWNEGLPFISHGRAGRLPTMKSLSSCSVLQTSCQSGICGNDTHSCLLVAQSVYGVESRSLESRIETKEDPDCR